MLDDRVNLPPPDLIDNLLPGYDATNGHQVGAEGSHQAEDDHGIRCLTLWYKMLKMMKRLR